MKKALALFLALVMCLSLICVPAFAEKTTIETVTVNSITGAVAGGNVSDISVTFDEETFSFQNVLVLDGNGLPVTEGTFVDEAQYSLRIILKANDNYAFKGTSYYEEPDGTAYYAAYTLAELPDGFTSANSQSVGNGYDPTDGVTCGWNLSSDALIYAQFFISFTATEDTGSNVIDEVTIALSGFEAGKQAAIPDIFIQPVDDYYNGNKYNIYESAIIDITGGGEVLVKNEDYFEAGHTYMLYIGLNSFLPAVFDPDLDVNVSGAPKGYKVQNIEVETWECDGKGTSVENGELVNAFFEITFTLPGGTEPGTDDALDALKQAAYDELDAQMKLDPDCSIVKQIIENAKKLIAAASSEGDILITKSVALDDIAKHLPTHSFYDALVGTEGSHGLIGFFASIFAAKNVDNLSTNNLIAGIFSLVITFINTIRDFFTGK